MKTLPELFENNKRWATGITRSDPFFFRKLAQQQSPDLLWIGCSDSRVPANNIVGLLPGELFVHRNVANLVTASDTNCLSVISFAIEVLKVKDIIVCGHYGCGGVRAAVENRLSGVIGQWLEPIQELYRRQQNDLMSSKDEDERLDRLCELNVAEQVKNAGNTSIVRGAWTKGQPLSIHGWIYSISNGLLRDLGFTISSPEEMG